MITAEQLTDNLNPEQAEAVQHHGTPLLIVAGAGSGKTRVITHRIAYLAHVIGIPIWEILAVTFTNKAAREMRERVCRLLGKPDDLSLSISTFHSRCAAILRREAEAAGIERNFAILDDRDQQSAVKKAMEDVGVDPKQVKPGQVQNFINLAKMKLLTPDDCKKEFDGDEIPYGDLYKTYDEIMRKNNSLDFEDLIFRTVLMLRENPLVKKKWNERYRYILVDEFQDTNHSQFELVKLLVGKDENVCVVGDEDQSIYSWRGADVQNLLQFKETYPNSKLVRLEQNYRSVANVLKAAGAVIEKNTMRIGKTLWTEKEEGELITAIVGADDRDEGELVANHIAALMLDGIPSHEISIFYRSHNLSRSIEDGLRKMRVPYRIIGGMRFYDRAEIKDILAFMRLACSPTNDLAFERVINVPVRGAGKGTRDTIVIRAIDDNCSQFEATQKLLEEGAIKGKARKGLQEFIDAIEQWYDQATTSRVSVLLKQIIDDTRYKTDGVGDPESLDGRSRISNIEEFEAAVLEFEMTQDDHSLESFLENMALDSAREDKGEGPKVSLMTIHNAKGLEFDYVFVVGMENGIFPNSRTLDKPEQFEEERRLFYVALTRARRKLFLTRARRRNRYGQYENTEPSIFLHELPEDVLTESDRRKLGISSVVLPSDRDDHYSAGNSYPNRAYGNRVAGGAYVPRRATPSRVTVPSGTRKKGFDVGDRVSHNILGTGVITEKGGRPGNERVYVEFDDGRGQEFVVRFAPLAKIEE